MQQDMIMLQSSSMKPQKKSKPPPLVLCNTEAQYWPLLSPLAEFAAIATSPESPLVKEMSYENGTVSNAFKVITSSSLACSESTINWSLFNVFSFRVLSMLRHQATHVTSPRAARQLRHSVGQHHHYGRGWTQTCVTMIRIRVLVIPLRRTRPIRETRDKLQRFNLLHLLGRTVISIIFPFEVHAFTILLHLSDLLAVSAVQHERCWVRGIKRGRNASLQPYSVVKILQNRKLELPWTSLSRTSSGWRMYSFVQFRGNGTSKWRRYHNIRFKAVSILHFPCILLLL